jgi:hypothetical protein
MQKRFWRVRRILCPSITCLEGLEKLCRLEHVEEQALDRK